jgi:hypothetical protein
MNLRSFLLKNSEGIYDTVNKKIENIVNQIAMV